MLPTNTVLPDVPRLCNSVVQNMYQTLRTNDADLAKCITKTSWLNSELEFACTNSIDEFTSLITTNEIRLATIQLSIDAAINNLYICTDPSDGLGGIKTLEDYEEDLEMEFMISGVPNEPSNIDIPVVPPSCDSVVHSKQSELLTLSNSIGKGLSMDAWVKHQVMYCIMETDGEM